MAVVGLVLLLGLALFHRPLLRLAVAKAGPWFAAKQGLDVTWKVSGSILRGVAIESLSATSTDEGFLSVASAERFAIDYDLLHLLREGPADFLKAVTLHDAVVKIDLRKLPPQKTPPDLDPAELADKRPPQLVWPQKIDLRNLTLDLTLADGRQIQLTQFSFQVGPGLPGRMAWDQLKMDPGDVDLPNVSAGVDWYDRRLAITGLQLPFDLKIDRLETDLTKLRAEGALQATLDARLSESTLHLTANVEALGTPEMNLDVLLSIEALDSADLLPLGVPLSIAFERARLELAAKGNPRRPHRLTGQLDLETEQVATAGVTLDALSTHLTLLPDGEVDGQIDLQRTTNALALKLGASLPEAWTDWQRIDWQTQINAVLPDVTTLMDSPLPLAGILKLKAEVSGQGKTPRQANGELSGKTLQWKQWKLPLVLTRFAINGDQASIDIPPLTLGTGNTFEAAVALKLVKEMPVDLRWTVQLTDPASLIDSLGLPPLDIVPSGELVTTGTASLVLEEAKAGNYSAAQADFRVKGQNILYGNTRIETVDLGAIVQDGLLTVAPWQVSLDGDQGVSGSASIQLEAPWAFTAEADIDLPELAQLTPLLTATQAPPITGGSFIADLRVTGEVSPWKAEGSLTADLDALVMPILPDPADLHVEATFAGTTATLNTLTAQLGPWGLATTGTVNPDLVDLKTLTLTDPRQTLIKGHLRVPVDLMKSTTGEPMDIGLTASNLNIREIAKSAGISRLPDGTVHADIELRGRMENATGEVKVTWAGLELPQTALSLDPANIDLHLQLAGDTLTLDGVLTQPPLKPLTLQARATTTLAALTQHPETLRHLPIEATLDLPTSDLSFLRQLKPDLIHDLPLTLSLQADASGTLAEPRVNALLQADAPQVGFASADLPSVRDVKVRIESINSQIEVKDLSAMLAGGLIGVTGRIDATRPTVPAFDLSLIARQALVFRSQEATLRANADLTCTGTPAASHLAGNVEAVRGYFFKELEFIQFSLPNRLPPKPPNTARARQQIELPPILKDWTFDVAFRTRDPLRISGNLAIAQISADAQLGGTGAEPQLTGQANVDQGIIQLPFSRMKVTRGVVTLDPAAPFNPLLDIRSESRVDAYEVTVYVYGSTSTPQTRFTSNPPLSEAQIASLLATGAVLDDTSSDVASRAASQAAFLAAKQLYRKVTNKPKVIEDEPPKLSVTYRPAGSGQQDDAVQATYELTDRVQVTGRFRQSGQMKMLLGYLLHFGEAARALDEPSAPVAAERPPSK